MTNKIKKGIERVALFSAIFISLGITNHNLYKSVNKEKPKKDNVNEDIEVEKESIKTREDSNSITSNKDRINYYILSSLGNKDIDIEEYNKLINYLTDNGTNKLDSIVASCLRRDLSNGLEYYTTKNDIECWNNHILRIIRCSSEHSSFGYSFDNGYISIDENTILFLVNDATMMYTIDSNILTYYYTDISDIKNVELSEEELKNLIDLALDYNTPKLTNYLVNLEIEYEKGKIL